MQPKAKLSFTAILALFGCIFLLTGLGGLAITSRTSSPPYYFKQFSFAEFITTPPNSCNCLMPTPNPQPIYYLTATISIPKAPILYQSTAIYLAVTPQNTPSQLLTPEPDETAVPSEPFPVYNNIDSLDAQLSASAFDLSPPIQTPQSYVGKEIDFAWSATPKYVGPQTLIFTIRGYWKDETQTLQED